MIGKDAALDPPKRLALAYLKGDIRRLLAFLLTFDARLSKIVLRGGEAVIGQMRMAWWRDVLTKPAAKRPQGEPLIAELSVLEKQFEGNDLAASLLSVVDAWDLLLAHEDWSDEICRQHAELRAKGIFCPVGQALNLADIKTVQDYGTRWALFDLSAKSDANLAASLTGSATLPRLPRKARALSLLTMAARQQYLGGNWQSGIRLMAHGLTGL